MEQLYIAENKRGTAKDYQNAVKNNEWHTLNNKVFTFVLNHRVENPSIKNSRTGEPVLFPNSFTLKLIDRVIDPKNGGTKVIRYLPTEETIEFKDQKTEDKNECVYAEFVKGVKHIPGSDKLLLEYFMNCNANGSNLSRDKSTNILFYMVDGSEGLKDVVRKKKDSFELARWCYDGNWDEVSAYARVLGIDIRNYDSSEVRHNLAIMAEKDPDGFAKGKDNPVNKRKHFCILALERGIIEVNHATRGIHWANSPTPISVAPPGVEPIDVFVEQTFTTQGEQVFTAIMEKLKPSSERAQLNDAYIPKSAPEYVPQINSTGIEFDDAKKLLEDGVSLGVITKPSTNTFEFNGEKLKSWSELITKLKDDQVFLDKLREAVKNAKN